MSYLLIPNVYMFNRKPRTVDNGVVRRENYVHEGEERD
jgi:hypothetical protein